MFKIVVSLLLFRLKPRLVIISISSFISSSRGSSLVLIRISWRNRPSPFSLILPTLVFRFLLLLSLWTSVLLSLHGKWRVLWGVPNHGVFVNLLLLSLRSFILRLILGCHIFILIWINVRVILMKLERFVSAKSIRLS